jgi:hypothetical protein
LGEGLQGYDYEEFGEGKCAEIFDVIEKRVIAWRLVWEGEYYVRSL